MHSGLRGGCSRRAWGRLGPPARIIFAFALDGRTARERGQNALGRNGRQYFQNNYDWRVIERKYLDMLAQLQSNPARHTMDPLPGRAERRRDDLEAAQDVLDRLPGSSAQDRRRA